MLKKSLISCLLTALFFLVPFWQGTAFSAQTNFVFPLNKVHWTGTGNISSKPAADDAKKTILTWQPLRPSAFLKSSKIPEDWHLFEEVSITLQSNKATRSWINILLCDKKNTVAQTYIEINFSGEKTFHLSFNDRFPSFNRTNVIDWRQISYFAFESHSVAHLGIEELLLTITRIELQKTNDKQPDSPVILASRQKKPVFFTPEWYHNVETNQEEMVQVSFHAIEQLAKEANLVKSPSPENLFYWTLHHKLQNIVHDDGYQNRCSSLFQRSYWESLLKQNDIFIQENGLFFLLTFDLLQPDLHSKPDNIAKYNAIITYLAEMEYNECLYWINTYPYGQGNNHVTRAASFLAVLAYYMEGSKRDQYYQFAQQVMDFYFSFQIDSEGTLNEGTHYYLYLMEILSYYGYFEWNTHQRNILKDFSYSPRLDAMTKWAEAIRMPNGFLPAIDDAWPTRVIFPIRLISPMLEDKERGNFFSMSQDVSNISGYYPWNLEKPLYIPLFLFSSGETFKITEPNNPPSRIFYQENQAVLKKDWSFASSYVLFTGKQKLSLHEHDDSGQIQVFADQVPVLLDSGYGPAGWSSKQREYYISGTAHNVVLIDGQGPKANYNGSMGPTDRSEILESNLNSSVQYISMNISRNVLFRDTTWTRSLFYIPETENSPYYCVIMDHLNSTRTHVYESVFHPNGELEKTQADFVVFKKRVPGTHDNVNIFLHFLTPGKLEIKKGFSSPYWGEEVRSSYLGYSLEGKQSAFTTLLYSTKMPGSVSVLPVMERGFSQEGKEYAFQVKQNGTILLDILFKNPEKKVMQGNWIASNGSMAYIRQHETSDKIQSYISMQASFLNLQRKPLFYAQKSIDYLYFSSINSLYDYFLEYESFALTNRIYLNLFDISKVLLDNKEVEFDSFSGGISFSLPPGKHKVILYQKGDI